MERERNHSIHRELFKHVAVALFRSTFSTLFALSTLEPRKQSIRHEFYFLGIPISFQRKVNPWKRVSCNVFTARRIEKCDIYIYIYTRRPPAFVGWQTRCEISRCILSGERVAQSVRYCRGGGGGGGLNAFVEVAMALRITRHPFCKLSMLYPFVPSFLFASFLLLASSTFISSLYKTPFLHLPRIDIEFSSRCPSLFFSSFVSLCLSPLLPFILIFIIDDLLHFFFRHIREIFSLVYSSLLPVFSYRLPVSLSFSLSSRRSCFPFPGSIMALKRNERPLGFNLLTGKRQKKYHSYSSSKTDRGCLARSIKRLPCLRQLSGLTGCALNESILDS